MEALQHCDRPTTKRSTVLGGLRSACRITILALLPHLGGDTPKTSQSTTEYPSRARAEQTTEEPYVPLSDIASGSSLVGKRVRCGKNIDLEIHRHNGELEFTVNGKRYSIQATMGVSVGQAVDMVTKNDSDLLLCAPEYGEAHVHHSAIEDALSVLAASNTSTVTISVSAHFSPREGTPLEAATRLKRMWNRWKPGECESFGATFVRKNASEE